MIIHMTYFMIGMLVGTLMTIIVGIHAIRQSDKELEELLPLARFANAIDEKRSKEKNEGS